MSNSMLDSIRLQQRAKRLAEEEKERHEAEVARAHAEAEAARAQVSASASTVPVEAPAETEPDEPDVGQTSVPVETPADPFAGPDVAAQVKPAETPAAEQPSEDEVASAKPIAESAPEPAPVAPARRVPEDVIAVDATDVDVSVEMQPGGTTTSATPVAPPPAPEDMTPPKRTRPAPVEPKKRGRKRADAGTTTYIRDIPTALVVEAKRMFPAAKNNTDAVTAYLAFKSGVVEGLTVEQRKLVRTYDGDDPMVSMREQLAKLERMVADQRTTLDELELTLGYLVFDRLGYRRENVHDLSDVNFLENGVETLLARMRQSTRQLIERERISDGRPRRMPRQ